MDTLHLIDVSSEDDCLITSPYGCSLGFSDDRNKNNSFVFLEAGDSPEGNNAADFYVQREQVPLLSALLKPEITRKNGMCDLRNSLAWDTSFFTSAGVLEPEELSTINNGLKKTDLHLLPGIEEDVRRSVESNSTLDSDSLTLETQEAGLFEDIRDSIQKSSKAFNVVRSSSKSGLGETGMQNIHASKKWDIVSQNRTKLLSVSKRQSTSKQGSERTMGTSVPQQSVQPARIGGLKSSPLKPPKILGTTANTITAEPTRRASLGANRVKMESVTAKAASGKPAACKKPSINNSSGVIPKSRTLSKSSSSGSSNTTKMDSAASCSSNNSSGSTSSDTCRSPLTFARRKVDSRSVNPPSSGSTLKTPQRMPSRSKSECRNSRLSTYLTSVSKHSSDVSPASTIDGWSSESSSSTSTVNQKSNSSKARLDIGSPSSENSLGTYTPPTSNQQYHLHEQPCVGLESQGTGSLSQHVKKASAGTVAVSHHPPKDSSRSAKPSGLPMPSPTIGFFDADKSVINTPNGNSPSHPGGQSGVPKLGAGTCNPNGGGGGGGQRTKSVINGGGGGQRTKSVIPQSARNAVRTTRSVKVDSQQTVVAHPVANTRTPSIPQLPLPSNTSSTKESGSSRITENCPGVSSKAKSKTSSKTSQANQAHTGQIGTKRLGTVSHGKDSNLNAEETFGRVEQKNKRGRESKRESCLNICTDAISACDCENAKLSENEGEKVHIENDLGLRLPSVEKENLHHFEDQDDALSSHMEVLDINMDVVKQLAGGKKGPFAPKFKVKYSDSLGTPEISSFDSDELEPEEDFAKLLSRLCPVSVSQTCVEIIPSTRTPLADKDSVCNRSALFGLSTDSTMEKVVEKASFQRPH